MEIITLTNWHDGANDENLVNMTTCPFQCRALNAQKKGCNVTTCQIGNIRQNNAISDYRDSYLYINLLNNFFRTHFLPLDLFAGDAQAETIHGNFVSDIFSRTCPRACPGLFSGGLLWWHRPEFRARVMISKDNFDAFSEIYGLILRASIDDSFTYMECITSWLRDQRLVTGVLYMNISYKTITVQNVTIKVGRRTKRAKGKWKLP